MDNLFRSDTLSGDCLRDNFRYHEYVCRSLRYWYSNYEINKCAVDLGLGAQFFNNLAPVLVGLRGLEAADNPQKT